jgi:hypothetical protein
VGQVKGAALREFVVWYQERHGSARLAEKIATLPPDTARQLNFDRSHIGVLASAWYPAAAIHALLDSLLAGMSADEQAVLAREGAEAIMNATLRGIYRMLFAMLMSPERYLRSAQVLWNRYYDDGEVRKTVEGPTLHRTVITGWTSHHRFLCDMHVESGRAIYREMGLADVSGERVSCVSRGDKACAFLIRWRKR